MGLFGKKENEGPKEAEGAQLSQGKYDEPCSLCGKSPTDKKWMGQYWHKKCLRKMKKSAKGMM